MLSFHVLIYLFDPLLIAQLSKKSNFVLNKVPVFIFRLSQLVVTNLKLVFISEDSLFQLQSNILLPKKCLHEYPRRYRCQQRKLHKESRVLDWITDIMSSMSVDNA